MQLYCNSENRGVRCLQIHSTFQSCFSFSSFVALPHDFSISLSVPAERIAVILRSFEQNNEKQAHGTLLTNEWFLFAKLQVYLQCWKLTPMFY